MRILNSFPVAVAAVMLLAAPAWAEPSPKQMELAKRYFSAAHMDRVMEQSMKAMGPAMTDAMAKAQPAMTSEQRQIVVDITLDLSREMMVKVVDSMLPILAETYTEVELAGLVAFYESPTGRALIDKQPELAAKIAPLMMNLMPEMMTEMRTRLCAKIGCPPAPAAKPTPS